MNQTVINSFPGYEYRNGRNMYRGTDMGLGGYIYSEPGMYWDVALLDAESMHPNSAINLNAFGDYTQNFKDILDARIAIKHGDLESAKHMFGGRLEPFLKDKESASALAQALKIAINSVYGLTSASFDNPFRDIRNKNNIVALRGALTMRTLEDEIKAKGFTVASIRTDSIKIPNATPEIIQFVMDFGKKYGYNFVHEATYDRMCLVNKSAYIAKYATDDQCGKLYDYIPIDNKKHGGKWTATAEQFQVPYVFKKLFGKEPIEFEDMCEVKSVTSALYLDTNEALPDVTHWERLKSIREKNSDQWTKKERNIYEEHTGLSEEDLDAKIAEGHNYNFIGKVGNFCPIKPGCGGGLLCREKDGKYYAATGSKGFRWLEAEMVRELGKEADIDRTYYDKLVDAAVETISQYGDFEMFVSD